jgi:putative transposase
MLRWLKLTLKDSIFAKLSTGLHQRRNVFFTVNLLQRHNNDLLTLHIDLLRDAVYKMRKAHPFDIHAFVVLPEHLHCVFQLSEGDSDFTLRWRLIKVNHYP